MRAWFDMAEIAMWPVLKTGTNIVLAQAGTHRTFAYSNCSMGPRLREDDVGLCFFGFFDTISEAFTGSDDDVIGSELTPLHNWTDQRAWFRA